MKTGYFDCFCGASGDMILGALIAAGLSPDLLRAELTKLNLLEYDLDILNVTKNGIAATRVCVKTAEQSPHRGLPEILDIINAADLPERVRCRAGDIFTRLAQAEAKVHGIPIDKVHFHEVGAVDAIVDIVGAAIGIEHLGIERIVCSPIPTGSGTVKCDHGILPIPAPATAELLRGIPLAPCDEIGELTTPTGAAVLATIADQFGSLPAMTIESCGFGAGSRDHATRPNVLRLFIGEVAPHAADTADSDAVVILETNLDDATGEQIGHAFDALFAAGALDVFAAPILMKKNRPGTLLSVICSPDQANACESVLFAETPTFGIRRRECLRSKLQRTTQTVATPYGDIRIKIGRRAGDIVTASPEYDDCRKAAIAHSVPLRQVMLEAQQASQRLRG